MDEQFKNKHMNSEYRNHLVISFITRYIMSNPESNQIDEITKFTDKYNQFEFIVFLKFLMPSDQINYIRIKSSQQSKTNRTYTSNLCKKNLPTAILFSNSIIKNNIC